METVSAKPERILPHKESINREDLEEMITLGVGVASVCWEGGTGSREFDSERASQVAGEMIETAVKYAEGLSNTPLAGLDALQGELERLPGMPQQRIIVKAKLLVFEYVKARLEKTDTHVTFAFDEVYVVWFTRVLQNWKALVSTTLPDGMYYEVTYNGDKSETYLDAYKKFENVCIPD